MSVRFTGNRMTTQRKSAFGTNPLAQKGRNRLISAELSGRVLEAQKKYSSSIKKRASGTRAMMAQAERETLSQRKKLREMIEAELRAIELRGIKIEWLDERVVGKARREQFLRNYSKELQNALNQLEIMQEVASNPGLLKKINIEILSSFNQLNVRDRQIILSNQEYFSQQLLQVTQNVYEKIKQQ